MRANIALIPERLEDFQMTQRYSEVFDLVESGRQERAVWEQVVDSLMKYVDTDTVAAADAVKAEGCVKKEVPQEIVSAVIEYIESNHIGPLTKELEDLENLQVVETSNDEAKQGKPAQKARAGKVTQQKAPRIVPRRGKGPVQSVG